MSMPLPLRRTQAPCRSVRITSLRCAGTAIRRTLVARPCTLLRAGHDSALATSQGLTAEEVAELQKYLVLGPAGSSDGDSSTDSGFLEDEEDEEEEDDPNDDRERVFLVGVEIRSSSAGSKGSGTAVAGAAASEARSGARPARATYTLDDSLEELGRLADTAGLKVVGRSQQSLDVPNNATYIGSGKVAEVAQAVRHLKVETVIFDDSLSPGQLRNLEKAFGGEAAGVRVCDRTALILDIFSQRAGTREGKLQVELAQTEYQLPRLTRMWSHLDRVGGGGQVKGAGEKQIEMDKRILRERASALKKELEAVRTHRKAYRDRRQAAPIPVAAIVGYTNAGKSTLLNRLTAAGVVAEDKLFATLDPTTRKIRLRGNQELLLSDTVGFIQKLPTELVAAFRATLEEIRDASVLLHVVDISHHNAAAQCDAVLSVLDELGIGHLPVVTAWNKVDCCTDHEQVRKMAARRRDTVCLSGLTGEGVEELQDLIALKLADSMVQVEVELPWASAGELVDDIHTAGALLQPPEYTEHGVSLRAQVPPHLASRLAAYIKAGAAVGETQAAIAEVEGWVRAADQEGEEEEEEAGWEGVGGERLGWAPIWGGAWVPGAVSGGESSVEEDDEATTLDHSTYHSGLPHLAANGWGSGGSGQSDHSQAGPLAEVLPGGVAVAAKSL
ncbi:GTP-binding family protein [Haematococcus lacustris]